MPHPVVNVNRYPHYLCSKISSKWQSFSHSLSARLQHCYDIFYALFWNAEIILGLFMFFYGSEEVKPIFMFHTLSKRNSKHAIILPQKVTNKRKSLNKLAEKQTTNAGQERSLNYLMSFKMVWIIFCGLLSYHILTQLNAYGRYSSCSRWRCPPRSSKTTNGSISFGRTPLIPAVQLKTFRICICSGSAWWWNTSLKMERKN